MEGSTKILDKFHIYCKMLPIAKINFYDKLDLIDEKGKNS